MANLLKISLGIAKYLPTPLVSAFHAKVTKASSKYCGSLHCLYTFIRCVRKVKLERVPWGREYMDKENIFAG